MVSAYTGFEADATHGGTFDDSHDVRIVFEAEERVVAGKAISQMRCVHSLRWRLPQWARCSDRY